MFLNNYLNLNSMESSRWEIGFQDPVAVIGDGIYQIYNYVTIYLVFIFFFLLVMGWEIVNQSFFETRATKENQISLKNYYNTIYNYSVLKCTHNITIEFIWTLIPGIILALIVVPSFILLYSMDEIIEPIMTFKVIGHQWYWEYQYNDTNFFNEESKSFQLESWIVPTDELELGELRLLEVDNAPMLPIESHIRVIISSVDVLHSWTIPSVGIKIDAVPGRLNQGTIFFYNTGVHYGQCSELCGVNHAFMPIKVVSLPKEIYYNFK